MASPDENAHVSDVEEDNSGCSSHGDSQEVTSMDYFTEMDVNERWSTMVI